MCSLLALRWQASSDNRSRTLASRLNITLATVTDLCRACLALVLRPAQTPMGCPAVARLVQEGTRSRVSAARSTASSTCSSSGRASCPDSWNCPSATSSSSCAQVCFRCPSSSINLFSYSMNITRFTSVGSIASGYFFLLKTFDILFCVLMLYLSFLFFVKYAFL